MKLLLVDKTFFMKPSLDNFVNIVYENFNDIANIPKLNHTHKQIKKILSSDNSHSIIIIHNKQIIGYLLGETHILQDGRHIYFINYLYVAKKFRNKNLASSMMSKIKIWCRNKKINFIMLNCDTNNKKVYDFYLKRGFMPDLNLRTYNRYDVLSTRI
jgi:GNAT superfamily N-acetyltransferase